jgi:DNA-binding transcriptional LysR family regulator
MSVDSRPTVRQLEYVVAVATHLSFRRAAAACGVTQPALSTQIATLERTLAVQVFERDRRAVLITPAGEEVVAQARRALAAVDEVLAVARRRGAPLVGPLRLGVIPTIAPYLLPPVLPAVRRRFPQLELILREEQTARLLTALASGALDCALLALPVPGDLTAAVVAHEEFLLAAPRGDALLRRRGTVRGARPGGPAAPAARGRPLPAGIKRWPCARPRAPPRTRTCGRPACPRWCRWSPATSASRCCRPRPRRCWRPPRAARSAWPSSPRPRPGRTIGLVWRTSSGRLREFRALADELASAATEHLGGLRARRASRRAK